MKCWGFEVDSQACIRKTYGFKFGVTSVLFCSVARICLFTYSDDDVDVKDSRTSLQCLFAISFFLEMMR